MAGLASSAPALATNGYFPHGYGIKAKGMGGVSTALAQDSLGGANNPASMVWAGSRMDLGLTWFHPERDAERSGAGFPTLNGSVDSGSPGLLHPRVRLQRACSTTTCRSASRVYGNGGMNTDYPQGNFNCGAGPANMLCGGGNLGQNLLQLIIAPTLAYKLAPQHSIGASLLLGYQRFKAYGLQAFDNAPGFPPFTSAPGHVTNNGNDSAYGAGLRIGWQGRVSEMVTVGAAYSTEDEHGQVRQVQAACSRSRATSTSRRNYSLGIAIMPTPAVDDRRRLRAHQVQRHCVGRQSERGAGAAGRRQRPRLRLERHQRLQARRRVRDERRADAARRLQPSAATRCSRRT